MDIGCRPAFIAQEILRLEQTEGYHVANIGYQSAQEKILFEYLEVGCSSIFLVSRLENFTFVKLKFKN